MDLSTYWQNVGMGLGAFYLLPLVALLLCIAILPLLSITGAWWEQHRNKLKVALICALAGMFLYLIPTADLTKIWAVYLEYAAFLVMLSALFVISGGIHVSGAWSGSPAANTGFLALGAVLANFLGTTGASMVLIRPLLRANARRKSAAHIVIFFIFIVCNCGGLLTPLGDPPLYLGFLRGVPFSWTLRLWPQWLLTNSMLLLLFYLLDRRLVRRSVLTGMTEQTRAALPAKRLENFRIQGWRNVFLLLAITGVLLLASRIVRPGLMQLGSVAGAEIGSKVFQIIGMSLLALCSYRMTSEHYRRANGFSFAPILEVAILFFGIFGAMIPALSLLEAKSQLWAWHEPWRFFWASGSLSGFLDNAPTYLAYVTLAASQNHLAPMHLDLLAERFPALLAAISCGTVFFGAYTYIGNGPNFMVKAMAEHARIKMPSFGGYMLWSSAILIPIFIMQTFIFFR